MNHAPNIRLDQIPHPLGVLNLHLWLTLVAVLLEIQIAIIEFAQWRTISMWKRYRRATMAREEHTNTHTYK